MEPQTAHNSPRTKRRRVRIPSGDSDSRSNLSNPPAALWLLRTVDFAFLGLIFVAPYVMGGRDPRGHLAFVSLIVVAAVAWFARQSILPSAKWTRSPADWLVPIAVFVVLFQLVGLPAEWTNVLSPKMAETLPIWASEAGAGALGGEAADGWSRLSVAPSATASGLTLLVSYGLLLWVVVQRCRQIEDVERLMKWIALAAMFMAIVALAQLFFSNEKFLWVYEHPFRDTSYRTKGPFINQNHLANFLALGMGPLVYWVVRLIKRLGKQSVKSFSNARGRELQSLLLVLLLTGFLLMTIAILLTASRGAAGAVAASSIATGIVLWWKGLIDRRYIAGLVSVGALVLVTLSVCGLLEATGRLSDLTSGSIEEMDSRHSRRNIWSANLLAFQDTPITGTGVGSHREVYPKYLENPPETEYTHAESGYFQISTETGVLGFGLLVLAIGGIGWSCLKTIRLANSRRVQACCVAVSAGLVVSAAHSTVDFVWYIPACMTLTVFLIGAAFCLRNLAEEAREKNPEKKTFTRQWSPARPVWIAAAFVVLLSGYSIVNHSIGPALAAPHWDAYLRNSNLAKEELAQRLRGTDTELKALTSEEQIQRETEMIRHLQLVLENNPNDARAHIRLAAHLLLRFEQAQQSAPNPMPLVQIRDAAIASQFESREALQDWLERAVGKHWNLLSSAQWHTQRGLALCPYQGEGYGYLARLCFLDQQGAEVKSALLDQALLLRPYDGEVLYQAGNEALLAGDTALTQQHWKRSFHSGRVHQERLLRVLKPQIELAAVLEMFEPELVDLPRIYDHFKVDDFRNPQLLTSEARIAYENNLIQLCNYQKGLLESQQDELKQHPHRAARAWTFAGRLNRKLERWEEQAECTHSAVTLDPHNFYYRQTHGEALISAGKFEEAKKTIQWCINRRPDKKRLGELMAKAEMGARQQKQQASKTYPATLKK